MSAPPAPNPNAALMPTAATGLTTIPHSDQGSPATNTPALPPQGERLSFLTINTQKTGFNSPSLTDLVSLVYTHSPDFLLLTETPMHPHSGALLHALCNREYKIHHHTVNAPFHPDGLPEARLPASLTHPGGGAWLAYKKHASWAPMVTLRTLPLSCPRATTCAVELAL